MAPIRSMAGANVDSSQPAGSWPTAPVTNVETPTRANFSAPATTSSTPAPGRDFPVHRGHVDLVRVASDVVAMASQHLDLSSHLIRTSENVARVGVARHHPERLTFPAPADQ